MNSNEPLPTLPFELLYEIFEQLFAEVAHERAIGLDPLLYVGYAPSPPHPALFQAECLRVLKVCKAFNRIAEKQLYTSVYLRSDPLYLEEFVASAALPFLYCGSERPRGKYTRRIRIERLSMLNAATYQDLMQLKKVCPNLGAISTLGALGPNVLLSKPEIWLESITSLRWDSIDIRSVRYHFLSGGVDTLEPLSLEGTYAGPLPIKWQYYIVSKDAFWCLLVTHRPSLWILERRISSG